jgi:hypothetical protein
MPRPENRKIIFSIVSRIKTSKMIGDRIRVLWATIFIVSCPDACRKIEAITFKNVEAEG